MTVIRSLLVALAFVVLSSHVTIASAATINCSAFGSQASAQAAYRANPLGLANLDRDRDGIACEDNPAPFDRRPVNLRSASTASGARANQGVPAAPVTGDGSGESSLFVNWTTISLIAALLLGLLTASAMTVRRVGPDLRLRRRD
jgi:hypothetical protein